MVPVRACVADGELICCSTARVVAGGVHNFTQSQAAFVVFVLLT